jgi:hypothetical protein
MNTKWFLVLLAIITMITAVSAGPNTGVASAVGSNNFTVAITASDGGDVWVVWGGMPGNELFGSQIQTGDSSLTVYGAPLIGGQTIWYQACDSTGCGNERTLTLLAITPIPTSTFGNAYRNLTARHFALDSIAPNILPGYTATGVTPTILWGIMFFFIFFGFWFRTRSVRMVVVLGILMAAFIAAPVIGTAAGPLGFNLPVMFEYVAQGFLAVAIAGILISFIRK